MEIALCSECSASSGEDEKFALIGSSRGDIYALGVRGLSIMKYIQSFGNTCTADAFRGPGHLDRCSYASGNSLQCLYRRSRVSSSYGARLPEAFRMQARQFEHQAPYAEFAAILRKMESEEKQDKEGLDLERTFILAVDFRWSGSLRTDRPLSCIRADEGKDSSEVYLSVDEELSDLAEVRISVRERRMHGQSDEIATKTVKIRKYVRVSIQISPEDLRRWWTADPVEGLVVEALLNDVNLAVHPQNTRRPAESMVLILQLHDPALKRSRRAASPVCTESMKENGCCLYDLVIDFAEFGWDFIIAPLRYNAYICRGDCTSTEPAVMVHNRIADNRLSTLAQVKHTTNCCHPTNYDPLKIVYLNQQNQMTVAKVEGMIARKCSC
ncbi:unnamed protein product [Cylicocyclus nassatus]|uniref:TGF-beta family profile domain-containing protein n=1 Tax=Cylicocyclus nassatus TaxID=53992 RepID=A0AA36HDM5_CYLNA|nr:unnamed protein product [Cylicocyclus nassatus]